MSYQFRSSRVEWILNGSFQNLEGNFTILRLKFVKFFSHESLTPNLPKNDYLTTFEASTTSSATFPVSHPPTPLRIPIEADESTARWDSNEFKYS
jgi:hypothetical protein